MKRFRTKKGITLIEVAAGLAILAMSMLFFSRLMADSASSTQAAADAKKLNMMARAAQTYINVEKADLEAFLTSPTQVAAIPLARNSETDLPPNGPHATLPSVQGAGLLASAFVDTNALGQRHALLVREPAAGQLEGMVVSYGGTAMSDAQLGKVVQSLGIAGGGVFAKDVQPVTATPVANANISGFAGGWVMPVASWNNFTVGGTAQTFAAGRPAISISMMDVVDGAGEQPTQPTEEEEVVGTVGQVLLARGIPKPNGLDEWPSAFTCLKSNQPLRFVLTNSQNSVVGTTYSFTPPASPAVIIQFQSTGDASTTTSYRCDGSPTIQQVCANGSCEYMPFGEVAPDSKRGTIGQVVLARGIPKPNGLDEWPSAFTCLKSNQPLRFVLTNSQNSVVGTTYSFTPPASPAVIIQFQSTGDASTTTSYRCDGNPTIQQVCANGSCEYKPMR